MMIPRERRIHDAPWLRFSDPATAYAFFGRFGVSCECCPALVLRRVTEAFNRVPYENLTKILKADSVLSAASAMRCPDEVIGDFLRWGTGGTCFSLTAALIALLDVAGIDAWPILADRHYGVDTHCGILIAPQGANMLLLDPGYLLFAPIPVPLDFPAFIETGFNCGREPCGALHDCQGQSQAQAHLQNGTGERRVVRRGMGAVVRFRDDDLSGADPPG